MFYAFYHCGSPDCCHFITGLNMNYEFTLILWDTTEVVITDVSLDFAMGKAFNKGISLDDIESIKIREIK
tara:strand:- start:643 stop:852 length:210 start_codon:yes stop_codon:yes gene_type:complete